MDFHMRALAVRFVLGAGVLDIQGQAQIGVQVSGWIRVFIKKHLVTTSTDSSDRCGPALLLGLRILLTEMLAILPFWRQLSSAGIPLTSDVKGDVTQRHSSVKVLAVCGPNILCDESIDVACKVLRSIASFRHQIQVWLQFSLERNQMIPDEAVWTSRGSSLAMVTWWLVVDTAIQCRPCILSSVSSADCQLTVLTWVQVVCWNRLLLMLACLILLPESRHWTDSLLSSSDMKTET